MSRILSRYLTTDPREWEQKLAGIIVDTGEPAPSTTVARATIAGDESRLRGIPCIARGVAGTSFGTSPHGAIQ
jgi:hypothetical protein